MRVLVEEIALRVSRRHEACLARAGVDADLEAADMFTEDELAAMRDSEVYTGWRVGLSESAEWVFFLAG